MADVHHSIKVAARRSGLSPHAIRMWERRYGAVEPLRTGTNRRAYSDGDIERLALLRQATLRGHNIGNVAKAPTAKLRELVTSSDSTAEPSKPSAAQQQLAGFMEEAIVAIRKLDTQALENTLATALVTLGSQGLLEKAVVPLAHQVGDLWRRGEITAAHEHFASAVIRVVLANAGRPFSVSTGAPNLIVATPTGQLHELGAVIVAVAARSHGWNVTYLGVGLPSAEIAGAAIQNQSRAVAISLVYPEDDPELPRELLDLRRFLPASTRLIVGGRAARSYGGVLNQIGAIQLETLPELYPVLDSLRSGPALARSPLPAAATA